MLIKFYKYNWKQINGNKIPNIKKLIVKLELEYISNKSTVYSYKDILNSLTRTPKYFRLDLYCLLRFGHITRCLYKIYKVLKFFKKPL